MSRGELALRDVVDHKPPQSTTCTGPESGLWAGHTQGAHLLVVLAVLTTAASLWRRASGRKRPVASSAAVASPPACTWCSPPPGTTTMPWPPTASCSCCCPRRRRPCCCCGGAGGGGATRAARASCSGTWPSGVLGGAGGSALCKYQGLTFLGVSCGSAGLDGDRRAARSRRAAGAAGSGGPARPVPPALYLAWAAAHDSAAATIRWFAFNFSYVGAGLEGKMKAIQRGLAPPAADRRRGHRALWPGRGTPRRPRRQAGLGGTWRGTRLRSLGRPGRCWAACGS